MNKRGTTIFITLMLGVIFFLMGMALAPALQKTTSEAMDSNELNCSNPLITQQNKAVCTSIDIFNPLWIGTLFGLAGLLIGGIAIR